jgi:hypothetical protein
MQHIASEKLSWLHIIITIIIIIIVIIIIYQETMKLGNYKNCYIGHCTHTSESADVEVH